jgi:hypothetical protein
MTHSPLTNRPYHFESNGTTKNLNETQIFQWSTAIPSETRLKSITLPPQSSSNRLHLFAMSYTPSAAVNTTTTPATGATSGDSAAIAVRRVRFTTKWELLSPSPSDRAQVVEVTLANLLPTNSLSLSTAINSNHTVTITGDGITTVKPVSFVRMVPGDQIRLDVLVTGTDTSEGQSATVEVRDSEGTLVGSVGGWPVQALVDIWTADRQVLDRHEVPTWVSR